MGNRRLLSCLRRRRRVLASRDGVKQHPVGLRGFTDAHEHSVVTSMCGSDHPDEATPLDALEERIARRIVADASARYLAATRERIGPFVDKHFSFSGARALHRRAVGWDLLRAPANLGLAIPQFGLMCGSGLARRAGWRRGADWMGDRRLVMETDIARELDWLLHTELLQLPFRQGTREATRDALAEAVFADPRIETASRVVLNAVGRRADDPDFRRDLERKLAVYTGSRDAAAEITTAIVGTAVGAMAFKQMTPGVLSMGPALAGAAAQYAAIASFPLGATLGGLWYGAFPATAGVATTVAFTGALVLAAAPVSAFAGLVADPVQRRLGLHQRRLGRLIDAIERDLKGDGPGRFEVRDHYVMRILDFAELLRAAWRAMG